MIKSKSMKKVLAAALALSLVMAPVVGVSASSTSSRPVSGNSASGTTTTASSTSVSTTEAAEIPVTSSVTVNGTTLTTTIRGAYMSQTVPGTVVMTARDTIAANYALEAGEQPEITVVCGSMESARAMEDCLSQRVSSVSIHCSENHHEVEQAHEAGLSVGKYRLLLELQKLDPAITADDIADLSMAQIRAMLEATDTEVTSPGHHQGHGHHGQNE